MNFTCKIPHAPAGVARRQLRVCHGQACRRVDVGLSAEDVRLEAPEGATARLLNFDAKGQRTRGPMVAVTLGRKAVEEAPAQPEAANLTRLRKPELLALATERGLTLTGEETRDQLLELLSAADD